MAVKLGDAVAYAGQKGHVKLAFVLATPETITPGHAVPELTEGQLHLVVFSPTGAAYTRYNVPSGQSVLENPDFWDHESGKQIGVWGPMKGVAPPKVEEAEETDEAEVVE